MSRNRPQPEQIERDQGVDPNPSVIAAYGIVPCAMGDHASARVAHPWQASRFASEIDMTEEAMVDLSNGSMPTVKRDQRKARVFLFDTISRPVP